MAWRRHVRSSFWYLEACESSEHLDGGLTKLEGGLTALRTELKQELGAIQTRLAALEASSTQLSARVDLLADDTGQRFRTLTERGAAIETRLAAGGSHFYYKAPGTIEPLNLQEVDGNAKAYQVRWMIRLYDERTNQAEIDDQDS